MMQTAKPQRTSRTGTARMPAVREIFEHFKSACRARRIYDYSDLIDYAADGARIKKILWSGIDPVKVKEHISTHLDKATTKARAELRYILSILELDSKSKNSKGDR